MELNDVDPEVETRITWSSTAKELVVRYTLILD
jgi:hypothetical protein